MRIIILIAICILLITILISTFHTTATAHEDTILNLCYQYETDGVIERGNCDCAKKLFPDFTHSYDWMDACHVLESKSR